MKKLFDENDKYTPTGFDLQVETRKYIWPVIRTYYENGYSIRDISHVIQEVISSIENELVLTKQVAKRKERRLNHELGNY